MLLAVFTTFAASRKEPLVDVVERVREGFLTAGFGEPSIRFSLSDHFGSKETDVLTHMLGVKRVSSIERVLKRWPQLERFARVAGSAAAGVAKSRVMSNLTATGAIAPVDFAILREIARGTP